MSCGSHTPSPPGLDLLLHMLISHDNISNQSYKKPFVSRIMLNMVLLLHVVNEGEHVVVNQVVEEVDPSVEVGFDIGGTTTEPNFSFNEG